MSENRQKKKDKETEGIYAALVRAGKRARLIAAQTGTHIVVMQDGKLIKEIPVLSEELKRVNESENEYKPDIENENENDASKDSKSVT
jgi:hypothetical protein